LETQNSKIQSLLSCADLELTLNPPEGIVAGPINEENFFEWEALITLVMAAFLF